MSREGSRTRGPARHSTTRQEGGGAFARRGEAWYDEVDALEDLEPLCDGHLPGTVAQLTRRRGVWGHEGGGSQERGEGKEMRCLGDQGGRRFPSNC